LDVRFRNLDFCDTLNMELSVRKLILKIAESHNCDTEVAA